MAPKKVALLIGSTRAPRVGPKVTDFVHKILLTSPATPAPELTIVDLKTFNLPLFDEAVTPSMVPAHAQFAHEHSKKWSAAIASYDGYIFVTGEYNQGTPGALKNAIDYLYHDIECKPVLIISYGILGGGSANEQVAKSLSTFKVRATETKPKLAFVGFPNMDESFKAAGGNLGEVTEKAWAEKETGNILKGYAELIELLETPPPAAAPLH